MVISSKSKHLKLRGHKGSWKVVSEGNYKKGIRTKTFYILEHEDYPDKFADIIADGDCNVVVTESYNGFDDLVYAGWKAV